MNNTKFIAWDKENQEFIPNYFTVGNNGIIDSIDAGKDMQQPCHPDEQFILHKFTGFTDKNGKEIYFDCSIIKITDYEYDEKWADGFKRHKKDLIFIVEENFFANRIKILSPSNCDHASISVLFNQNNAYGHLNYPSKMEIIGDIYQNTEYNLS